MEKEKRVYVSEVKKGPVFLQGWVHELRDLAKIKFLLLRDVSGIVQCIVKDEKLFAEFSKITLESVVSIKGEAKSAIVKSPEVTDKTIEIDIKDIELISKADALPIPVMEKGVETTLPNRLDNRFLDLRKPKNLLIFQIETEVLMAMRDFCIKNGFLELCSPKLQSAAAESGAEMFSVDYFGKKAYLAQSPQFYKQMAMLSGFEKVFEIAPVFRANPSHTTRHDTEFTMVDIEVGFINSVEDIMKLEEKWIQYILKQVKEKFGKRIKEVFNVDVNVPKIPFPRITMDEAHKIVRSAGIKVDDESDLDSEGEKILGEYALKKLNHEFVFLTGFPWKVRPFYHMKSEDNPKVTKSYDLIWKGLEITTGAQREHRHDKLVAQAKEKGIGLEPIKWYLDMFRYGAPPHGGFGLSPTRVVMQILNLPNVREATFAPRDTERLTP
jgi:aspartyl-tRNA synthetase